MQANIVSYTNDVWIILLVYWILSSGQVKHTARRQTPASRLFHLALIVPAYWLIFAHPQQPAVLASRLIPHHSPVAWLGFGMTAIGGMFALWARVVIGPNWSGTVTVKEKHALVCTGPYRFVRHPIYCGLLTATLGTAIVFGVFSSFLGVVLAFVAFYKKWRMEEQFMTEEFGDEYVAYCKQVKAIIPFVF